MEKEKTFTVMVNGAANSLLVMQFCYLDQTTGQYKWVDQSNKVRTGAVPNRNVQIYTFSKKNPYIKYKINPNMPSSVRKETEDLIDFWKNHPEVGKRTLGDNIDSFPSENHKRTFASIYNTNPYDALPPDVQRLVYIDEEEVSKEKSKVLNLERKVLNILEEFKQIDGLLAHYAYMLGINPEGYGVDEIETLVYDKIANENSHEMFLKMTGDKIHNDPTKIAVHIGISSGIITKNPSGIYQFEGNLIGKNVDDLAFHFKQQRNDWNVLIARLGDKASNLPKEQSMVTHKETLKNETPVVEAKVYVEERPKVAKPKISPADKLTEFVEDEEIDHPLK
jgi:hypothetical protein